MQDKDAPVALEQWRIEVADWIGGQEIPAPGTGFDERFPVLRDWQRRLNDAGFIGVDWPADSGGRGLSLMHQHVVYEELIRRGAPLPVDVVGLDVVGPTLIAWGTGDQKRARLPRILSGAEMWCQGFSEPDAGSDLASMRTTARVAGDEFVINGQKIWTSHAQHASWCALLARSEPEATGHRGLSYIMVPMDAPGIEVRPIRQMTGDSEFNEVFFTEVRVPLANVMGPLHQGWTVAWGTLSAERSRHLLQRRVQAQVAFDELLAQVRGYLAAAGDRGSALPPDAQRRIGEVAVGLEMLGALSQRTARRLGADAAPTGHDSVDKILLGEAEQAVYSLAEDLLGPYRVARTGSPLGLRPGQWVHDYLYSRSMSISGGTYQIQHNIVAERLLGLPREPRGNATGRPT
jgi:alkylation response protein AidB-like acyl-CoA dehydrogenase